MENKFEKYQRFTITDFVMDDDFIHWANGGDEERNQFWEEFISQNPDQLKNIKGAKVLLSSLDTSVQEVPDEIKNRVWESIQSKSASGKVFPLKTGRVWMAAASVVVLLLAAGSYFYFYNKPVNHLARVEQVKTPVKNDVAPGGNKAILTLANGATIVLDNAQKGSLAQQGNSKVIKLDDGKLAYQLAEGKTEKAQKVVYNTVSTPRGGQYQLTLSDGSKVWLNAASSITFPTVFTSNERDVSITGEVYFEVKHDASMPFHVKAGDMQVQVLGTHFNVNAYADDGEIKTTLLEGSVKVDKGRESVLIIPGEQAVSVKTAGLTVKKDVDVDEVIAWKNGLFNFNDADLKTIMQQLSRWYNVNIIYKGEIPHREFGGEMQRDLNLSQVLKLLEKNNVHFKIEGNNIVVEP